MLTLRKARWMSSDAEAARGRLGLLIKWFRATVVGFFSAR